LIIAVVAGLAALAVSQLRVAPTINGLRADLESKTQEAQQAQSAASKARKEAQEAVAARQKAESELETTKADLEIASTRALQQETRANDLEGKLNVTTRERNEARDQLAEWKAFGKTVQEIQGILVENKQLLDDTKVYREENRVLVRNVNLLKNRLDRYEGTKTKVELPAGLKGKVLAVDPKYEFVVLDVGADQGALERGELLVNRSGRLVAKVQILSVQPRHCIANVLPDWKQAEIMEGDLVVVGL
jgi:chromosome segregation ATPase